MRYSADWVQGWLAFQDTDADNAIDVGEDILQMWRGPGEENVTIAVAGLGAQRVQFTPTGMVNPNTVTKTYLIHSNSCETGANLRRRIQVDVIGSILSDRMNCP